MTPAFFAALRPNILHGFCWGCLGAAALAVPLTLDPVNATNDPAVAGKVLALKLLLSVWTFGLGLLFVRGVPAPWKGQGYGPPIVAVTFWIVAAMLSALFSGRFLAALSHSGHLIALPTLVLCTVLLAGRSQRSAFTSVAAGAATGASLCAVYGLLVLIGRDPLAQIYPFQYAREDARNFMHSFLGNPEYFGGYSSAIAAGGLAAGLFGGGRAVRMVGWMMAGLMALCVVLSGTRGAFIGFALVGMGLLACRWPFLCRQSRRRVYLVAGVGAVIGGLGLLILSTENPLNRRGMRLAQRFTSLFDPNSASVKERILFYGIAAETTVQNPILGAGPGSYQMEFYPRLLEMDERDERGVIARLMYDLRNRVAEHAHSDWLEAWSEGGALGGAAFLLLGVTLAVRFRLWARRLPGSPAHDALSADPRLLQRLPDPGVVAAGCAVALCFFVNSAFSFPLHMPARATVFWAGVAVFIAGQAQWMVLPVKPRNTGTLS